MLCLNTTELEYHDKLRFDRWLKNHYANEVNRVRKEMEQPLLRIATTATSSKPALHINYNEAVAKDHDKLSAQWHEIAKIREVRIGKLDKEVALCLSAANFHKERARDYRVRINNPNYRQGTVEV